MATSVAQLSPQIHTLSAAVKLLGEPGSFWDTSYLYDYCSREVGPQACLFLVYEITPAGESYLGELVVAADLTGRVANITGEYECLSGSSAAPPAK